MSALALCVHALVLLWPVMQGRITATFGCQRGLGEAACSDNAAIRAGETSTSMPHQRWQWRLLHSKKDEASLSGCEGASELVICCWHRVRHN